MTYSKRLEKYFERINDGVQRRGDIGGFRLNKVARDELADGIFNGQNVPEVVEERHEFIVSIRGDLVLAACRPASNLRGGKITFRVLSTTCSWVDLPGIHGSWNVRHTAVFYYVQVVISADRIGVVEIGFIILIFTAWSIPMKH